MRSHSLKIIICVQSTQSWQCHITIENVTLSFDIKNTSDIEGKHTYIEKIHQRISNKTPPKNAYI